jgi:Glycosyltransferase Family 4
VSERLRIALLDHDHRGPPQQAGELAVALTAAGHDAEVIAPWSLPDAPLRLRKIGERPGRLPLTYLALRRGGYDLAHAFTAQDAWAAVRWSRATGRPCVFTCVAPLRRATLADRRGRLALLRRAVEETDAVIAPDEEVAASLRRWMAVEPRLVARGSAAAHLALYEELLGGAPGAV